MSHYQLIKESFMQLKKLHGDNDERALNAGSGSSLSAQDALEYARRSNFILKLNRQDINGITEQIAKAVSPMPDAAGKVQQHQLMMMDIMDAAKRTIVASSMQKSLLKSGHDITVNQLLSNKPLSVGSMPFFKQAETTFTMDKAVSLINRVRQSLEGIFVDQNNQKTPDGIRAVNRLMQPIEKTAQKNPAEAVTVMLTSLAAPTQQLSQKIEHFVRACGMTPDLMNGKTLNLSNQPRLGN
jgi:hypothetical protein